MLTQTTISGIRALTYLGSRGRGEPVSPRRIAGPLGESPTYLAKVVRLMARAGLLRAQRGVGGGVVLARPPREITLLSIVEACQGAVLGDFCEAAGDLERTCAFHQAAAELHRAVVQVMSHWTLEHFVERPGPDKMLRKHVRCWVEMIEPRNSNSRGIALSSRAVLAAEAKGKGRRKQKR